MGIPDVYSSRSRLGLLHTFRWVYRVDAQEIDRRVGHVAPIGRVLRIIPGQRGMGGYVNRVTVVGTAGVHTLQGDAIRSLLGGLKSTAFKVQPVVGPDGTPQSFLFWRGIWPWGGAFPVWSGGHGRGGGDRGRGIASCTLSRAPLSAPTTTVEQALLDERYEAVTAAALEPCSYIRCERPAWRSASPITRPPKETV